MIYAIGLDSDKTYLRLLRVAHDDGCAITPINLRAVARRPWSLSVPAAAGPSVLELGDDQLAVDPAASFFVRLIDLSSALPAADRHAWRHLMSGVHSFLASAPGLVINRPGAHAHNAAKPLHEAWLRAQGLAVPEALTASDGEELAAFAAAHDEVIVKALCGMRGIARLVTPDEFGAGFDPASGPVHLQRCVRGDDVRVHVVGDEAFAIRVVSDAVDYRAPDAEAEYAVTELPRDVEDRIVAATRAHGLVLAGWDFKVDREGTYWCLEVNPMPGYDMYDRRADGAISRALLRRLEAAC